MHALLGAPLNQVMLVEQGGPGADKTHIALDNAPQLRQFIQTALAQETANRGEITQRIAEQMGRQRGRANLHTAKLWHLEYHIVTSHACRPIQPVYYTHLTLP